MTARLAPWMEPDDLAPGDVKSLGRDWSGLELDVVESAESPSFVAAFEALWAEFGKAGEMERPEVLARRLAWDPATSESGAAMLYQLMLLRHEGRIAAVTDQTAILIQGGSEVIVHHSHILVDHAWRRTGLAGWTRSLPIHTARNLLAKRGLPRTTPVTIAGEMEHPDHRAPATLVRLTAMGKAGFKKIDPARVRYLQPDFRAHREIDRTGSKPLPLALVLRRIGRENEDTIKGKTVRLIANALYRIYGREMRPQDMAPVLASLAHYPADDEDVALLSPDERPLNPQS